MEMWKEKENEACRDKHRETEIKRGTKRKRQGWETEKGREKRQPAGGVGLVRAELRPPY